jgi:WD40 repeat protein
MSAQAPKLRDTLQGQMGEVVCVTYSPDGKTLASGSRDKTIKLRNVATAN